MTSLKNTKENTQRLAQALLRKFDRQEAADKIAAFKGAGKTCAPHTVGGWNLGLNKAVGPNWKALVALCEEFYPDALLTEEQRARKILARRTKVICARCNGTGTRCGGPCYTCDSTGELDIARIFNRVNFIQDQYERGRYTSAVRNGIMDALNEALNELEYQA